jgi:glycogen synthase kinase 3 alpha
MSGDMGALNSGGGGTGGSGRGGSSTTNMGTSFPLPRATLGQDRGNVTTVVATLGQGPEHSQEVS